MLHIPDRDGQAEPTSHDLAAIEEEWPLIAAEVALVDAEIRVLTAVPHPTTLDWRRLRRAEHRVATEARAFVSRLDTVSAWTRDVA